MTRPKLRQALFSRVPFPCHILSPRIFYFGRRSAHQIIEHSFGTSQPEREFWQLLGWPSRLPPAHVPGLEACLSLSVCTFDFTVFLVQNIPFFFIVLRRRKIFQVLQCNQNTNFPSYVPQTFTKTPICIQYSVLSVVLLPVKYEMLNIFYFEREKGWMASFLGFLCFCYHFFLKLGIIEP